MAISPEKIGPIWLSNYQTCKNLGQTGRGLLSLYQVVPLRTNGARVGLPERRRIETGGYGFVGGRFLDVGDGVMRGNMEAS